jgi:tight adherence protein B
VIKLVIVVFILSTIGFGIISTFYIKKNQKVKRRIEQLITLDRNHNETNTYSDQEPVKYSIIKKIINGLAKRIKLTERKRDRLEKQIESAGIPLKVEEYIAIRLILFVSGLVIPLVFGVHLVLSILIGMVCGQLPAVYMRKKRDTRITSFTSQLPQALETMASAMKSGFSFMQAMQLVSKEMPDPIGIEFGRTIKEINLGISIETSFENLLKRLPNKDLEIMVTAVLIQRSTGGNLAQVLETIHETISERVRMKDEIKALTSQGRMSAIVISLLPFFLGVILHLMNPEYFTPMFSHPLGLVLLGGGLLSGLLGWLFINKIVKIEV